VIDTREQLPYRFDPAFVEVSRCALAAGDYSIAGHETEVAVERKSLPDFIASVIQNRDRFSREMARLSAYRAACVVVEADLRDVVAHKYRSWAHPNAVLGSVLALHIDFGVPFIFCSTREIAGRFTSGFLRKYFKRIEEGRVRGGGCTCSAKR
jgi:ERCC4-type nuclease